MPPKKGFRETKKAPAGAKKKPEKAGYPGKEEAPKEDDTVLEEAMAKAKALTREKERHERLK